MSKRKLGMSVLVVALVLAGRGAFGEDASPKTISIGLDTLWVLLAAFLVFFMQAGFGMVEAGFIRTKNACNILTKNFLDYCIASVMFFLVGYALMFGKGNAFLGWTGLAMEGAENPSGVPIYAFWLFQAAFCGAAATIVAGGMAERMKFSAYLIYTAVVSALVYPIVGHWIWNSGGWLAKMGFGDFAGSTVVHSLGGYIALTGTVILGPRIGKFAPDGRAKAIPGHSIPLASLGVFLLWFGWFGFNPGSTLAVGDGTAIGRVAMNTNLSACTGALSAMVLIWLVSGKPDLSMTMNGCLAGLVAITAPCAYVSPIASLLIGVVAGVVVVGGVLLLDRIGVDDPVGAVPVHALNGTWGTLAVGLWGQKELGAARDGLFGGGGFSQLGIQLLGNAVVVVFAVGIMAVLFLVLRATLGLRVSREEEIRGLDIGEHGMEAYSGFQIFVTQ